MSAKTDHKKTQQRKRIIFISSLLVSAFWLSGRIGNVYRFPALGAIYESFWLPALALLVVLPVISFYYWSRKIQCSVALSLFHPPGSHQPYFSMR
ncbi:MAG: hypothetical protein IPI66_13690 [Chitinophagaceae bacterium]|nr:hypothetical protein [Chitinophagaceae bacterium]